MLSRRGSYFPPPFWRDSPQWATVSSFTRFLDHTQRRTTDGRTLLDEASARRRDLSLPDNKQHSQQTSMPRWDSNPQSHQASGHWATGTSASYCSIYILVLMSNLMVNTKNARVFQIQFHVQYTKPLTCFVLLHTAVLATKTYICRSPDTNTYNSVTLWYPQYVNQFCPNICYEAYLQFLRTKIFNLFVNSPVLLRTLLWRKFPEDDLKKIKTCRRFGEMYVKLYFYYFPICLC